MIERYATANVIAKILALRLDQKSDREVLSGSALPGLFRSDKFMDVIGSLAPGGTVMDSFRAISQAASEPLSLDNALVKAASSLFPDRKGIIEGATLAYLEDPKALMDTFGDQIVPVVTKKIGQTINPSTLVRCPQCKDPYYTDGQSGCPHC